MIDILLFIALAGGIVAAAAALYGHYFELPEWMTGPEICRMDGGGCAVLFRSPRSALLGVPNASLGLLLYGVLTFGVAAGWPSLWLWAMTLPALAMSVFLGYSLITNGHQCRICWTGHFSNLMLFLVLAWRTFAS